jgi:hypothetical protein
MSNIDSLTGVIHLDWDQDKLVYILAFTSRIYV